LGFTRRREDAKSAVLLRRQEPRPAEALSGNERGVGALRMILSPFRCKFDFR